MRPLELWQATRARKGRKNVKIKSAPEAESFGSRCFVYGREEPVADICVKSERKDHDS